MRALLKVAAALAVCVGLIGLLHMPFARGLLASVGGCPFPTSGRTLTAAEAEALRVAALRRVAGHKASGARAAAGFELGRQRRSDIARWAAQHQLLCTSDRHGAGVACEGVSGGMLPMKRAQPGRMRAMFAFDTQERLVGVQLQSTASSAKAATESVSAAARGIAGSGGEQLSDVGKLALPLGQARARARASNYSADLVITHLGDHYAVYESYQAL